ncbi:23S rRNA (pseudouridine(1915)-N(3))-methyltransferase RlmH, partial [Erysipelotrichaceae bacterium OttesenSCG-928-M19]|nr:23S rRNA (pseudouridine(1915)-N(3))-methyltransferase RlmH [Erysipelotrichaceae bacterium OttesenSCG-928-M19]
MKIKIVCVGKIKEKYLNEGIMEYLKRLQSYAQVEIIEVSETKINDNPNASQIKQVIDDEASKMENYLNEKDYLIALDVKGKMINNQEYVSLIENAKLMGYSSFCFIIGGSYGLGLKLKEKCHFCWSLSKLVMT